MSHMSELHADLQCIGADALDTPAKARVYIRSRMKDARLCIRQTEPKFTSIVELAKYLKRYW